MLQPLLHHVGQVFTAVFQYIQAVLHVRSRASPKAEDTPVYDLILIEDPEPTGPYGAKGISEVATVPMTPAILNAIYNAIGIRINRIPASPKVIREAIRTGSCEVPSMEEMIQAGKL